MGTKDALSGKFVLRAGIDLHGRLYRYAQSRKISLNEACKELLENALSSESIKHNLPFGLDKLISASSPLVEKVIGIILYGSWARGESTEISDIDILAIIGESFPVNRAMYGEVDRLLEVDSSVSLMLAHLPHKGERPGSLWLEVAQDGILLYDKNNEVARALSEIRRQIASGKVLRRESHGQGYWVYA